MGQLLQAGIASRQFGHPSQKLPGANGTQEEAAAGVTFVTKATSGPWGGKLEAQPWFAPFSQGRSQISKAAKNHWKIAG